ncbi:MAG TPA: carboxylating nicotinate-nucleotide diphosphorylase [Mycobacteriales bacterium]|nr:carboxylating nicotinate-nucleotide diphosphorylase [Mycobacteriales bacterium]
MNLPDAIAAALTRAGLDPAQIAELAQRSLDEDLLGGADVTSVATIPADQRGIADIAARAQGVVAGLPVAAAVFAVAGDVMAGDVVVELRAKDGDAVAPGDVVLTATGPTRTLLTAERSALNIACHLSGIATQTRRWVDEVAGTGARILDTRKTTPGLRVLEKYAVRCGGGGGYRMGLSDAAMVKDNHVVAAGGVVAAYRKVREMFPDVPVEVECDRVSQVAEVIEAGAELILLDNMSLDDLRASVRVAAGRAKLEASGGLSLDRARAVAETGVDFLSVGALTHSAPVLDLGFDLRQITEGG